MSADNTTISPLSFDQYHVQLLSKFCFAIKESRNQVTKQAMFGPGPNVCQYQNRGCKTFTRKLHTQPIAHRTGTHDNPSRSCMQLCGCCIGHWHWRLTIRALTVGATICSWHLAQDHFIWWKCLSSYVRKCQSSALACTCDLQESTCPDSCRPWTLCTM